MEENTKNQIDAIAKEIEVKFENVASTNKDELNALTEKFNELNSRIDAQEVATKKFFDMTASDANVQKIATYFRISEEMLADTPQLTSYLSARAPEKLLEVEDTQILSGTGVAPQLSGIITDSTDFAAGGFANAIESANEFDVLTVAMNQLALANYQANYIMINPTDFHKILLLKDSNNNYLKDQWYQGLEPRINGVPVVLSTAITSDKYLIGNFNVGTQLWIRDNVSVEFFREDGTNVRDGFVTCRVMERVALTNYLLFAS